LTSEILVGHVAAVGGWAGLRISGGNGNSSVDGGSSGGGIGKVQTPPLAASSLHKQDTRGGRGRGSGRGRLVHVFWFCLLAVGNFLSFFFFARAGARRKIPTKKRKKKKITTLTKKILSNSKKILLKKYSSLFFFPNFLQNFTIPNQIQQHTAHIKHKK
jgi:hypothetical protein